MALTVYYDGDCPFCSRYITMLRLSREHEVALVDLRDAAEAREQFVAKGFDVDKGMVVDQDGQLFGGADAVNVLALQSTPSNGFNRMNRAILGSQLGSRCIYPFLRLGRWIAMFLLGRNLISGEHASTDARRTIFAICFALFSVFHFCNYATEYGRFPPSSDQVALLLVALLTLLRPQSSRVLFALMSVSLISAWVQAPVQSNHTITRNFLLLGYWLSFGAAMIRNRPASDVFKNFVVSGRGVLIMMYVFGIFHKINTDFLNPVTSCATALWRMMPWPLPLLHGPSVDAATIYGTFVVEGAIMVALLVPRWRHVGISAGIAFHLLLSLSSYAMYISFTTLSIAMHSLFLDDDAARRIMDSREMRFVRSRMRDPAYFVLFVVLLLGLGVLAFKGSYTAATLFALPLVLPYCFVVLRYGKSATTTESGRTAKVIGIVTTGLFFINCFSPYLGLKTAQSVNMFANLRLEGGESNHLIFSGSQPFQYLERVATITDDGGDAGLGYYSRNGFSIVYYDLLSYIDRKPGLRISYSMDGREYRSVSREELKGDIASTLHPWWVRKWLHFQPVKLERPERCNL